MTPTEQVKERILSLEQTILESNPRLPILLREIKLLLVKDPEIVTNLSEEDIGIIVSGLKKQVGVELLGATTASAKKKSSKIGLDDL